jgi:hypothetical protein
MSEQITLDDLDIIWMEDGLPCFFADRDDICDIIESFGFNIYYLIGNEAKEIKPTTTGTVKSNTPPPAPVTVYSSKLFKVVNNFVGRSVSISQAPLPTSEFISVEEQCVYNMPAIPHILIEKLDQFFRLVDAQHGTESIVMLTYDLDKTGPSGWGILVPDQTNTSVHCNYDPDSIAKIKPDNVMIVGSVHSHPGMAAYASGTDHADQADFDGIHITFGWQKSVNNGATQYYIELQMAGSAYKLDPEDVFEDYVLDKAPDPEVVGWTDKVKKVSPPSTGGTATPALGQAPQPHNQQDTHKTQASTVAGTSHSYSFKNQEFINYPPHISQILNESTEIDIDSLLICEAFESANTKDYTCPGCFTTTSSYSVYADNCCSLCDLPLSEPDTSADQLIWNMFDYCKHRNIQTDCALYLCTRDSDGSVMLLKLTPTTMDEYASGQWADVDTPTTSSSTSLTLCCSSKPTDCYCPVQVDPLDSIEFDSFVGSLNVYHPTTRCAGCINYYDSSCPSYAEQIVDFMNNKKNRKAIDYEHQISGEDCTLFNSYLDIDNEGSLYY